MTTKAHTTPTDPWISLNTELPLPNKVVHWYDAMFDLVTTFALPDPSVHDGDFTHWMPVAARPAEYTGEFGWPRPTEAMKQTTLFNSGLNMLFTKQRSYIWHNVMNMEAEQVLTSMGLLIEDIPNCTTKALKMEVFKQLMSYAAAAYLQEAGFKFKQP